MSTESLIGKYIVVDHPGGYDVRLGDRVVYRTEGDGCATRAIDVSAVLNKEFERRVVEEQEFIDPSECEERADKVRRGIDTESHIVRALGHLKRAEATLAEIEATLPEFPPHVQTVVDEAVDRFNRAHGLGQDKES